MPHNLFQNFQKLPNLVTLTTVVWLHLGDLNAVAWDEGPRVTNRWPQNEPLGVERGII